MSPSVSVGDFVFIDENRDGIQDAGDTPVEDATLTLTDPNGDPVTDVFGDPVGTVQTDVNGCVHLRRSAGARRDGESYTVTIDPSTGSDGSRRVRADAARPGPGGHACDPNVIRRRAAPSPVI